MALYVHRICRRCQHVGRSLSLATTAFVEYYRCEHCGHVWVQESDVPDSPPLDVTLPASARTRCPECDGPNVVDLADLLNSTRVDYFRCRACDCWWMVPKSADGPATRIVFGNPNPSENKKQAG